MRSIRKIPKLKTRHAPRHYILTPDPAVRKTMVIDDELYSRAVKRARALCFPSFSDYLQALFRKDAGLTLDNDTPPTELGGGGGGGNPTY
jgi:hypothetical protein